MFADWKRLLAADDSMVDRELTKRITELHAVNSGRPLASNEFKELFGALPADAEG